MFSLFRTKCSQARQLLILLMFVSAELRKCEALRGLAVAEGPRDASFHLKIQVGLILCQGEIIQGQVRHLNIVLVASMPNVYMVWYGMVNVNLYSAIITKSLMR